MTLLREDLKKELDKLSDEQLKRIADFVAELEFQDRQSALSTPFWQRATSTERVKDLHEWVLQLPKNSPSLADEAFNRDSIYEE
jgi:mRNA-degrading endonuclease RelE of RelBE toxin-antitoxin system